MNDKQKADFSDLIISIHRLATSVSIENPEQGFALRLLADEVAILGNTLMEKEVK